MKNKKTLIGKTQLPKTESILKFILAIFLLMPIFSQTHVNTAVPGYVSRITPKVYQGDILLSGQTIPNTDLKYPVLSIAGNYYFPLDWNFARAIGLETEYKATTGLNISITGVLNPLAMDAIGERKNFSNIGIVRHRVTVNEKLIASHLPVYNIAGVTYVCFDQTNDFQYGSLDLLTKGIGEKTEIELPNYYSVFDSLDSSKFVRNQGSDETCWAFAANSLLEIKIAMTEGTINDFSEEHLINLCPIPSTADSGGNWMHSLAYFINDLGPVPQHVGAPRQNYRITETSTFFGVDAIKKAVLRNGGAVSSVYYGPESHKYFSREHATYNTAKSGLEENHQIVVVGWDDNFPRELFNEVPKRNGAFLVLNSHGKAFGQKGLFYVSYEDPNIKSLAFTIDDYQKTENKYPQVLISGETGVTTYEGVYGAPTIYGAVRFNNIQSRDKSRFILSSVGFFAPTAGTHIKIYYSRLLPKKVEDLRELVSYYSEKTGYQSVDLKQPLILSPNFYIILKYSGTTTYKLPVEAPYPGIRYTIHPSEHKSFILSESEGEFIPVPLENLRANASIVLRLFGN